MVISNHRTTKQEAASGGGTQVIACAATVKRWAINFCEAHSVGRRRC